MLTRPPKYRETMTSLSKSAESVLNTYHLYKPINQTGQRSLLILQSEGAEINKVQN